MRFVVRESNGYQPVWTEDDWPVVPRTGETVLVKGKELEVQDVDHDFKTREISVIVRVPLGVRL